MSTKKEEKVRWCHTCSKTQKRLVEVNLIEALEHYLKGHWVRSTKIYPENRHKR